VNQKAILGKESMPQPVMLKLKRTDIKALPENLPCNPVTAVTTKRQHFDEVLKGLMIKRKEVHHP
jgi:hypothetical protein